MRLICPNCDAEYEVDPSMIPLSGRDVQCSNCEIVWFQAYETDQTAKSTPFVAPTLPDRKKLDAEALAVIEEEVAFDAEARGFADDAASIQANTPPESPNSSMTPLEHATARNRQTGRFQDVEEINSALPDAPAPQEDYVDAEGRRFTPQQKRARGFRSGFGLTLIASAGLLMAYTNAPILAQRAPQMTSGLASYVRSVDKVRVWLDGAALGMTERMDALVDAVGETGS